MPSVSLLLSVGLVPNPRTHTPRQKLFDTRDDRAFITTMGVDVDIIRAAFSCDWSSIPISRQGSTNISTSGIAQPACRPLNATRV